MEVEKIIEQILSKNPEISRDELLKRLERERKKTGGLFSEATILKMIAAEYGVEIPAETELPSLSIANLIPGLSDVTVVGRVMAVFTPKGKGRGEKKFASLLIADQTAMLRVVLWNDKVSFLESNRLKVGDIVRFSHCYTTENREGFVELHVGERGEIQINPLNVKAEDYPHAEAFATKIRGITGDYKGRKVVVIGKVKELFPASTFKRKDSSSGKVMRVIVADETGSIPVVIWNEKVDELEKTLKMDDKLQIINAKVKKGADEGFELHVNAETSIHVVTPSEELLKIADLKEHLNNVSVMGEVATKPILREVKTSSGEIVKLAIFELKDETGSVWVSAWRKHAENAFNLKVGDKVVIRNAYVKKGFADQLEISTRNKTSIEFFKEDKS
ncbi:MAG: OB-fold nucleic acid binding domain-containing protein [Candidatus Bathyarchaeia archaeon]